MNRDLSRLKELVNVVLPAAPDDSFSLDAWEYTEDNCNTVYCACGWAAQHRPFKEAGLKVGKGRLVYTSEDGDIWASFDAASEFFDITMSAACYLFDPEEYPEDAQTTKAEVIDRITNFIKDNQNG